MVEVVNSEFVDTSLKILIPAPHVVHVTIRYEDDQDQEVGS